MRDITSNNFGLLIAYVLPGFTILWESRLISPSIESWLAASTENAPTVAGFLYATLGSVAIGLFISTLRWLIIDSIHHRTGIPKPEWDFTQLAARVDAFQTVVDHQYRYHQFYGGMTIAVLLASVIRWVALGFQGGELLFAVVVSGIFFLGSRDTLKKYYFRMAGILTTQVMNP